MNRHPGRRERSCWTLKTLQLRLEITDVQWILGHQSLSTTQIYVTPTAEDVIASALAHHQRAARPESRSEPPPSRYRPESLDILFGRERS